MNKFVIGNKEQGYYIDGDETYWYSYTQYISNATKYDTYEEAQEMCIQRQQYTSYKFFIKQYKVKGIK